MSTAPKPVNGWTFSKADVGRMCQLYGPLVKGLPGCIDLVQLMWAFALTESYHKGDMLECPPRFEPAYFWDGKYCDLDGNAEQKLQGNLCALYSADASKSYGPWQVMYLKCHGAYRPEEFGNLENCAKLYLMFMNDMLRVHKITETDLEAALNHLAIHYNGGGDKTYAPRLRHNYFQEILG